MLINTVATLRQTAEFELSNIDLFKQQALVWSNQFDQSCLLDNNDYILSNKQHGDVLIAAAAIDHIQFDQHANEDPFLALKKYYDQHQDWLFGHLSYDLKNHVEKLSSGNLDNISFPDLHFFRPKHLLQIIQDKLILHSVENPVEIFQEICSTNIDKLLDVIPKVDSINSRIPKQEYLTKVEAIRQHIVEGDLYEMNFCQEFYATNYHCDPTVVFHQLNQISKAPYTAFYKINNRFLMCASPERYIQKIGQRLISQPIKGTIKRGVEGAEDEVLKKQLDNSVKDRAENVMIVDLVRNDLARSCKPGSVKVKELFGIYPFQHVFQMISTIHGELKKEVHFIDALKLTFPMGSMTGAPKVMSMELIEKYERSKRGLYSGTVGYISPEGDFDFNVVIRSLLYNAEDKYLSFQVGGAIVYDSDPENEYQECLLKAKGMRKVLGLE